MSPSSRRWAPMLGAFIVLLVVALILQGMTHSAVAAWVAIGSLVAVMVVRWVWLS